MCVQLPTLGRSPTRVTHQGHHVEGLGVPALEEQLFQLLEDVEPADEAVWRALIARAVEIVIAEREDAHAPH